MLGFFPISLIAKSLNFISARCMSHKVFVYGTLKQNEPNHYWLCNPDNGLSTFLGNATTTAKYPLIIATKYNIPFLLKAPGKGYFVKGEVYEVDDKMLSKLDILEDHPNYYIREYDDVELTHKQPKRELVKCWVYFLQKFKPELLNYPMMDDYSSSGPHGKPYLERSKRDPNSKYDTKISVLSTCPKQE